MKEDPSERAEAVVDDLSGVELGDSRLDFRARQIARRIAMKPAVGFPDALVTSAELEGLYRFLGNEKVSAAALLKPHSEATIGRAADYGTVLAIHDTTVFRFGGTGREGLGELTRAGDMFLAHFCLAVSADGSRDPLGVLGTKTWARDGTSGRTRELRRTTIQVVDRAAPARASTLEHAHAPPPTCQVAATFSTARLQNNLPLIGRP
jgi:hypothetical protein